ncbi:MAG TPA: hypothetical protein VGF48_02160 [Thermoanaerobaculia bacterium]|jgi:hypothetical protein
MLIGLITWSGLPQLSDGDRLLGEALQARGADARAVVWDDPGVRWTEFDALVVRSTWDYHRRAEEFGRWIDARESDRSPLWNPPALLRRNTHKRYLLDLAARGVEIVPTELVPRGSSFDPAALPWPRFVAKPAISATAFRTLVAPDAEAFAELVAESDVLVQPFIDAITDEGEWSLIFLGGHFSHAVLKRPKPGDFRVQNDFGGSAVVTQPDAALIDAAARVLAAVEEPWLYARVDGVVVDGHFQLMELEMTEPSLFLELVPEAAERMATSICAHG